MGDNVPDCELNRLDKVGDDFGFPYCHAGDVVDPEFGKLGSCGAVTCAGAEAGSACRAAGRALLHRQAVPGGVSEPGVRRSARLMESQQPIGYRIMQVKLDGDRVTGYEPFLTGWLQAGRQGAGPPGRPAAAAGRLDAGVGRPGRRDLPHLVQEVRRARTSSRSPSAMRAIGAIFLGDRARPRLGAQVPAPHPAAAHLRLHHRRAARVDPARAGEGGARHRAGRRDRRSALGRSHRARHRPGARRRAATRRWCGI